MKHHNHDYDGGSPNIPKAVGDRYYSQDLVRDFWAHMDAVGRALRELGGTVPFLLTGGVVTKGTGDTLNITAGTGVAKYSVRIPDDSTVIPPTSTLVDLEGILIEWTAQTNMAIAGATLNGVATNYVKIAYAETDGASRQRAKKTGTYPVEKTPSFLITVNTTAPTDYEVCVAQFVGTAGGAFTISIYASLRSIKSIYDGRFISGYLHGDNYTQDQVFDALSSFVPNVNDKILISGCSGHLNGGIYYTLNYSYILRYDSSTIRFYCVSVGATSTASQYIDAVNGSSTYFVISTGASLSIAW